MSSNIKLNHFRGYRGYGLLNIFLSFGLTLIFVIVMGLLQRLGVTGIQSAAPFIVLVALLMAAHFSVGRFISIEARAPQMYDTNSIALFCTLVLGLFFLLIYLLVTLIGGGVTSDFSKFFEKEFLGYFGVGALGFILIFQIILYLFFGLLSRFRQVSQ